MQREEGVATINDIGSDNPMKKICQSKKDKKEEEQ